MVIRVPIAQLTMRTLVNAVILVLVRLIAKKVVKKQGRTNVQPDSIDNENSFKLLDVLCDVKKGHFLLPMK